MTASAIGNKVEENVSTARTIAQEGMVLLKNNGMLPFTSNDVVIGLGTAQDVGMIYGGEGSGWVNATQKVSYADGLRSAATFKRIKSYTAVGSPTSGDPASKVLYFISRRSSEGGDNEPAWFYLNAQEKKDIEGLIAAYGAQKLCVVLNVGGVMDTSYLIEKDVGAIVCSYYGGEQAGNALADLLTGAANFSGKTVDTWAKAYEHYPSVAVGTFAGDCNTYYTEDVYVGYRYFETFDPQYEKVNYEFGYGLSYSQFEIKDYKFKAGKDAVTITATVRNRGPYPGKEVMQVYFVAPQGDM